MLIYVWYLLFGKQTTKKDWKKCQRIDYLEIICQCKVIIFIQKYFFFLLDLSTDHNIFKYLPNFFLISN